MTATTSTTAPHPTTTSTVDPTLHRCDRCGHRACVLTQFISGTLAFCGHHFTIQEAAIRAQALQVIDHRHTLTR